jgi:8-oxo-dGTP diphosphatase
MSGDIYKNKTRIRVNGLLIEGESILLVQIKSPVNNELVWMPPGGGLQFGESMNDCLCREFKEETGLEISLGSLVAVNELVKPPFHAVECYFEVHKKGGKLSLGNDPEHAEDEQVLRDLKWISFDQLDEMNIAPQQLQEWMALARSQKEQPQRYFQTKGI